MFKGFKTILFGLFVALLGPAISYFETLKTALETCKTVVVDAGTSTAPQVAEICTSGLPTWIATVIGGLIIILRFFTTTSVFQKK
jgi:hypothetical protein